MVMLAGVSFRSASKLFAGINLYLGLNLGQPTHATILNWVKKQGVANFREKNYFDERKWVLIVDESVLFGSNKLLFVVAVPADFEFDKGYVGYKDITPLVIKVSNSWKAEDISNQIREHIDIKQVAYAVSDNGSNLLKTFGLLAIPHIEDINHKFSWIMQQVFEDNPTFKSYTKELSDMRAKLSMSKVARIVPPNQRIMSRYMNLEPLFAWGNDMLKLLKTTELTAVEKEKLAFLCTYEHFIIETYALICKLNQIQKLMKNSGFSRDTIKQSLEILTSLNDDNAQKVKCRVIEYLHRTALKMSDYQYLFCSSDIVESCFSKYKGLAKENKAVGLSSLALCLSAMMAKDENLKGDLERIKTEDVGKWAKENIGKTLFAQKMQLRKKIA